MKKKHKTYSRPKRPFDKVRLDEEREIVKEFGLKNKKEIWKADAKIKSMREKAKKLITAPREEQEALFERLNKVGMNVTSISDILALDKKDYLNRRLQTVLVKKGLGRTPRHARQLITHKKVLVNGKILNIPSYVVPTEFEDKITVKEIKEPEKKVAPKGVPSEEGKDKKVAEVKENGEGIPEVEKAEAAEADKKTDKDVQEVNAEVKGE
jgi:small subunit ribosomal protein S4